MDFADTGVLSPGQYQLLAEASWDDSYEGATTPASFDFVFEVVPEPGTGVLVGGGLALFAGVRQRRVTG